MTQFARLLAERQPDPTGRSWVFVPYDQLTDKLGPLARRDPRDTGIVLVESRWKAARRPYHQQKLALVLANLRHFALEQAARGVAVRHVVTNGPYREAVAPLIDELGPLELMEPAERELRVDLAPLVADGRLRCTHHEGWMTSREQFLASRKGSTWRMDAFYRQVRRQSGILMEGSKPAGGRFSFDADNRRRWTGVPTAAVPPRFVPDEVTLEVGTLVSTRFGHHPGQLDLGALPATAADAARLWGWAKRECLPHFGPFEDAMTRRSTTLFHSRVSSLVNLHRLLPSQVVDDVLALEVPLQSKEGFVRQVLGWREFVHHVHVETDGLRHLPSGEVPVASVPGDAGYARWSGRPWSSGTRSAASDSGPTAATTGGPDGGARCSQLGASRPLPPAFWGRASGLACLDAVVGDVWREGYSHHITRLMVLANLATLLDVSPRDITDWFWVAYTDAYDWVVEPNVLGMGTYAAGDLMTTKPYVSGAGYIDRMSDYCEACPFSPGSTCPVTPLYWAFLARHEAELDRNPRMAVPLSAMRKRSAERRARDRETFEAVSDALSVGRVVNTP